MKLILALLVCALLDVNRDEPPRVDSESLPKPYVVAMRDGFNPVDGMNSFYFKMTPDPSDQYKRDKGMGYAYQVAVGKDDKLIWTTSGWYSFDVFLSHDGRHLVRIGNWPQGDRPKAEDVAIAFYESGRLVKSYSTLDVIADPDSVPKSVSHYDFVAGQPRFVDDGDKKDALFRLPLVNDGFCVFRVDDASLVTRH